MHVIDADKIASQRNELEDCIGYFFGVLRGRLIPSDTGRHSRTLTAACRRFARRDDLNASILT